MKLLRVIAATSAEPAFLFFSPRSMTVTYSPDDVVALEEFAFLWRINDERWAKLSDAELSRIIVLSDSKAARVSETFPHFVGYGVPFDERHYRAVSDCSLEGEGSEEPRRWLRSLPIAAGELVYVCWKTDPPCSVILPWNLFFSRYDDFWYRFDAVAVFDDRSDWAVLLGPEESAVHVVSGGVPPELPPDHPARGKCLIRWRDPPRFSRD